MNTEYLQRLCNSASLECLWESHCKKMSDFGFDRLIYGCSNYVSPAGLGDFEDFIVLSNHNRDYTGKFLNDGLFRDSPMMAWALNNSGSRSWRISTERLEAGDLSDVEKQVYAFNHKMGVTAGYTISFPTASHMSKAAIALTARRGLTQDTVDEIWAAYGDEIELINGIVHLKISTLPYTRPKRALTNRQREVLEWVGLGKTVQEIATLIGRTPATVEKHLRLAREALNVDTTAQALMKASFQHQIFTIQP